MKGALWLGFWCLFLLGAKEADTPRHPLLIDAGGDWCDVPAHRAPMKLPPRNPLVKGLDKPNGETA